MSEEEAINIAETLHDKALKTALVWGIGLHHAGLDNNDRCEGYTMSLLLFFSSISCSFIRYRKTIESLYSAGRIQVLVATSTLAWGVNLPCHLVIVKGTEYFDGKTGRYVDFPVFLLFAKLVCV
jgi:activating signal cointegrator complex subunit 3